MSETYEVIYSGDESRATAAIDRYLAKLVALETAIDRIDAKAVKLGSNPQGLKQLVGELATTEKAMQAFDKSTEAADNHVAKLGSRTSNLGSVATKATSAQTAIDALAASATAANNAVSGLGSGMQGVNFGGGGRGGGVGAPPVTFKPGAKVFGAPPVTFPGQPAAAGGGAGLAVGAAGAMAVRRLMGETSDAFSDAEKAQLGYAEKTAEFRDDRREIAAMMGKQGPDNAVIASSLKTMLTSGMTAKEEAAFTGEYYGSSATGREMGNIGRGLNDKQREALEQQMRDVAARFAVQKGMDPKTAGDLAGVVSQYMPLNSAEDLAGQLNAMYSSAQEGRGLVSPMIQGMLAQAPAALASGRVSGLPEFGAWVGMASTFSKSAKSAGVTYSWLDRALGRTQGASSEYLGRIGVDKQATMMGKLDVVSADLDKVQGDKLDYLARQGFGSMEDRRAILAYYTNRATLKANITKAKASATKGKEAIQASLADQNEPNTARRLAESKVEASEVVQGTKYEDILTASAQAKAQLVADGGIDTSLTNVTDFASDWTWNIIGAKALGQSNRKHRIQNQANQNLREAFGKAGVSSKEFWGKYSALNSPDIGIRGPEFARAMNDLRGMGGSLGAGDMKGVEERIDKLIQMEEEKKQQRMLPPPIPPGPPGAAFPGRN